MLKIFEVTVFLYSHSQLIFLENICTSKYFKVNCVLVQIIYFMERILVACLQAHTCSKSGCFFKPRYFS